MIISMWAVLICLPISMKYVPLKEKDNSVFHYFQLLDSYWCDNPEPKTKCSGNADKSDMKNQLCNFKCNNTWENITCMDSENGALYFCIPKNTTCIEGITWRVDWERSALKEGVLAIVDDHCPQDYYQEKLSRCYNACKEKHEPLAIIPKGFKIFSKGNHTHPTMLMCNNAAGYFSSKNQTIFRYDKSFKYSYHDLCIHNVTNACVGGQISNGSCVIKCRHGNVEGQTNSECIEQPSTEPVSPPPTGKDSEAPDKEYSDNSDGSDVSKSLPTWVIVIIVIISVTAIGIAIACCCYCNRYCEYQEVPREKKQGNIQKNKTIVNGNLINIYSSGNVQINKKNVPDDESRDSSQTTVPEINEHDSDDLNVNEHDLEDLKEHLNNQDDIGRFTSEETRVKEL